MLLHARLVLADGMSEQVCSPEGQLLSSPSSILYTHMQQLRHASPCFANSSLQHHCCTWTRWIVACEPLARQPEAHPAHFVCVSLSHFPWLSALRHLALQLTDAAPIEKYKCTQMGCGKTTDVAFHHKP